MLLDHVLDHKLIWFNSTIAPGQTIQIDSNTGILQANYQLSMAVASRRITSEFKYSWTSVVDLLPTKILGSDGSIDILYPDSLSCSVNTSMFDISTTGGANQTLSIKNNTSDGMI
jgi:hypothetical protein